MVSQNIPKTYSDYTSIIHAFQVFAATNKERPFVHFQQKKTREYKTLTYNEFDKITTYLANKWGSVLLPAVDTKAQCVASLGHESGIQSLFLLFTIWKLGFSYFPISIWCDETAVTHLLKQENVGYVIASEPYFKANLNSATTITIDNTSVPIKPWEDYDIDYLVEITSTSNDSITDKAFSASINRTAVVLVTGGSSSGIPKAVRYSHRAFLYSVIDISLRHEDQLNGGPLFMKPTDVWILAQPVDRMSTIYFTIWAMLIGASAILFHHDPPLTMQDVFEAGKIHKPSWTYLTPYIIEQVAEYLQEHSSDDSDDIKKVIKGVKLWMSGGAPVRLSTAKYLKSRGLNLTVGYGASEFGSLCTGLTNNIPGENRFKFSKASLRYMFFESYDQNIYRLIIRHDYPGLATDVGNCLNGDFATSDLFIKHIADDNTNQEEDTWNLVGRISDTFKMENGKRIYPTPMEWEICTEEIIQNCIVVGENKKCAAVLIALAFNKAIKHSPSEMIKKVYEAVKHANKRVPDHSGVNIPSMVYTLPLNKKLPISDKGTVFRKGVNSDFAQEIQQLYDNNNANISDEGVTAAVTDLSIRNN